MIEIIYNILFVPTNKMSEFSAKLGEFDKFYFIKLIDYLYWMITPLRHTVPVIISSTGIKIILEDI